MCPCWYAFQGVACILSPYGAFTEKPPALPGDVCFYLLLCQKQGHCSQAVFVFRRERKAIKISALTLGNRVCYYKYNDKHPNRRKEPCMRWKKQ